MANMPVQNLANERDASPFDLGNARGYAAWRASKLQRYPASCAELMVNIENPRRLSKAELTAMQQAVGRANLAIYSLADPLNPQDREAMQNGKDLVADLGAQFGLRNLDVNLYADDDGISALQVSDEKRQFEYIPYSNRAISWHTDGYYNTLEKRIRGMILHCVSPAARGGENALVDHEMIYLQLRDENPAHIEALMQPEVMTIPANIEGGVEIRGEQTGPVFSIDEDTGSLHMRYTARTRSIVWQDDAQTRAAVKSLEALLAADSPFIYQYRLQAGQGIICNNVLHKRAAFTDDKENGLQRLFYRARYYDRMAPPS